MQTEQKYYDLDSITTLSNDRSLPVELPPALGNDHLVRQAMMEVLSRDEETILAATKELIDSSWVEVYFIELIGTVEPPSPFSVGSHNDVLIKFAFDAFDILAEVYQSSEQWGDWLIMSYFAEGDDLHEDIILGIFVRENQQQVVE